MVNLELELEIEVDLKEQLNKLCSDVRESDSEIIHFSKKYPYAPLPHFVKIKRAAVIDSVVEFIMDNQDNIIFRSIETTNTINNDKTN